MPATAKELAYRVKNRSKDNESLVSRGDITLWFSDEVIDSWEHENAEKRAGHPFVYSDLAIETLLTIRELFRLPYRQTEGFGRALAKLMSADVPIPDYTSLQKRAAGLGVSIDVESLAGPVDVVVDSTGLKVFGDGEWGEWKVKKHGAGKRRTWRKLHLAVDPSTHLILAESLTQSGATDASQVEPLIEQVEQEVETFYGDGYVDFDDFRGWKRGYELIGSATATVPSGIALAILLFAGQPTSSRKSLNPTRPPTPVSGWLPEEVLSSPARAER